MCGILGLMAFGKRDLDERRFVDALATLRHRGPDGERVMRIDDKAMFGHARLSIIDLSHASDQPMLLLDRYVLTYNGEIFNYLELRAELEREGVQFDTSGDVEVLLRAYIAWGEGCVKRFNGMWAFAIYDKETQSLFCSRDRFGIKPFNYAVHEEAFFFSSEIKAILSYAPELAEPDYGMISNFCRTSVGAQHERTWFREVRRLMPGCNMTVTRDGRMSIARYWEYPSAVRSDLSFDQAVDAYRTLFFDAVRLRMRSDVPIGITLSSGVDSNSIAYAMHAVDPQPHHSYTSRFLPSDGLKQDKAVFTDGELIIDEAVTAERVAAELNLRSHTVDTTYDDFVGEMTRIVHHLESGNSAPAVVPLMQLLAVAKGNVTVLLEGQGADELLGGYVTALIWQSVMGLVRSGRLVEAWKSIREFSKTYTLRGSLVLAVRYVSNGFPVLARIYQRMSGLDAVYGPRLRGHEAVRDYPDMPAVKGESWVRWTLRRQHAGGLVNLLHYGDAISMAQSIEARTPFLDHRLVEFSWRLPDPFKICRGVGKVVHREALRGIVPDDIIDNRAKYGFTTPIGQQFRKRHADGTGPLDVLLSGRCLDRGLFDRTGLEKLMEEHRAGKADRGALLYRLLLTEIWFRTFIDLD